MQRTHVPCPHTLHTPSIWMVPSHIDHIYPISIYILILTYSKKSFLVKNQVAEKNVALVTPELRTNPLHFFLVENNSGLNSQIMTIWCHHYLPCIQQPRGRDVGHLGSNDVLCLRQGSATYGPQAKYSLWMWGLASMHPCKLQWQPHPCACQLVHDSGWVISAHSQ